MHQRIFALMTRRVAQGLVNTLALVALAVGGIDAAHATSDRKAPAKVTEPAAVKPVPAPQMAAPQSARVDEPAPQAKPSRPIAPQTPPPARTTRPGTPLPAGPVAIVRIPPSTLATPKIESKSEPVKPASAAPGPKSDPKKPAPKKLVQAKPAR